MRDVQVKGVCSKCGQFSQDTCPRCERPFCEAHRGDSQWCRDCEETSIVLSDKADDAVMEVLKTDETNMPIRQLSYVGFGSLAIALLVWVIHPIVSAPFAFMAFITLPLAGYLSLKRGVLRRIGNWQRRTARKRFAKRGERPILAAGADPESLIGDGDSDSRPAS